MPSLRQARLSAALALAALCLAALGARLAGIGFFLPHSLEPDAVVFVTQQRALLEDQAEPWRDPFWGYYPNLIPRLAALVPGAHPREPSAQARRSQAEHLHDAAAEQVHLRRVVAWLSVLVVPGTYLLARRFLGRGAALLAAALAATSLLDLWFAQQARPHAVAVVFALFALLAQLRLRRRGDAPSYALAALGSALAIGALNSGLAVLPSFLAAHLLRRQERGLRGRIRRPWLAFALALLAVAATIPWTYPYLFAPADQSAVPLVSTQDARLRVTGHPLRFESLGAGFGVLASTLRSYEPGLALLTAAAAAVALGLALRSLRGGTRPWRELLRERGDLAVVLAYALPYALVVGLYAHSYQRFALPLLPHLAVFAAWGLAALAARSARAAWIGGALAAALIVLQGAVACKLAWIRTQPDTHALVGAWVRAHARPEVDRILLAPRVDLPLWRTRAALEDAWPPAVRLLPWLGWQLAHEPPAGEPCYELRALMAAGKLALAEIERDPAAFLAGQPFDVLVLDASDYPPAVREAKLREGARTLAVRAARYAASDDPARERAWLNYQDDEVAPRPDWWLEVLRARRFGPALEIWTRPGLTHGR